jgi:23S rRNA pseudouridine2605 synthase
MENEELEKKQQEQSRPTSDESTKSNESTSNQEQGQSSSVHSDGRPQRPRIHAQRAYTPRQEGDDGEFRPAGFGSALQHSTGSGYGQRPYRPRYNGGGDDNGYQPRQGGYQPRQGGYQPRQGQGGYRPRYNNDNGQGEGGYQPRQNSYRPRYNNDNGQSEGGYRPRYNNDKGQSEGGYRPRYNKDGEQGEGGYRPRQNSYRPRYNNDGDQQSNGYQPRQGGYQQRQGGYQQRQGGYQQRPGGYRPRYDNNEGGYQQRQGGYRPRYNNNGGGYNQGGYNQGGYRQHSADYDPNAKYSLKKRIEYKEEHTDPNEPIRLNKYLANAGVCSRREADEFIQNGVVTVNGEVIKELGTKVKRSDAVQFNGKPVSIEKKVYVLLNKPKDCVTTSDDPEQRQTVMDIVKDACPERIYPVGRLDRNTTGVLLLTNDGELASKLTHPRFLKKKVYQVILDKPVAQEDMQNLKTAKLMLTQ